MTAIQGSSPKAQPEVQPQVQDQQQLSNPMFKLSASIESSYSKFDSKIRARIPSILGYGTAAVGTVSAFFGANAISKWVDYSHDALPTYETSRNVAGISAAVALCSFIGYKILKNRRSQREEIFSTWENLHFAVNVQAGKAIQQLVAKLLQAREDNPKAFADTVRELKNKDLKTALHCFVAYSSFFQIREALAGNEEFNEEALKGLLERSIRHFERSGLAEQLDKAQMRADFEQAIVEIKKRKAENPVQLPDGPREE